MGRRQEERPCGVKVSSPTVFSVSGLTSLDSPPGGAGGLTPPCPTQGSFEEGKRKEGKELIVPGKTKSEEVVAVSRAAAEAERRTHPPPVRRPTNHREGSIYWQKPNTFARSLSACSTGSSSKRTHHQGRLPLCEHHDASEASGLQRRWRALLCAFIIKVVP